jgi:hypothetical protein
MKQEFVWLESVVWMIRDAASGKTVPDAAFLRGVADEIDELLAERSRGEVVEMMRPKIIKAFQVMGTEYQPDFSRFLSI